MGSSLLLAHALTAAALAGSLAVVFTAPTACIAPTFMCGLVTYLVRDGLAASGMNEAAATTLASATAPLVALAVTPRSLTAPVVVVAAIFPLSAGVAVFDAVVDLVKVSTYTGAELQRASLSLTANLGRAFTTFGAIAFGLEIGLAVAGLLQRPHET